jgi:hypothetical protein
MLSSTFLQKIIFILAESFTKFTVDNSENKTNSF